MNINLTWICSLVFIILYVKKGTLVSCHIPWEWNVRLFGLNLAPLKVCNLNTRTMNRMEIESVKWVKLLVDYCRTSNGGITVWSPLVSCGLSGMGIPTSTVILSNLKVCFYTTSIIFDHDILCEYIVKSSYVTYFHYGWSSYFSQKYLNTGSLI